jgi:hypothetical protein
MCERPSGFRYGPSAPSSRTLCVLLSCTGTVVPSEPRWLWTGPVPRRPAGPQWCRSAFEYGAWLSRLSAGPAPGDRSPAQRAGRLLPSAAALPVYAAADHAVDRGGPARRAARDPPSRDALHPHRRVSDYWSAGRGGPPSHHAGCATGWYPALPAQSRNQVPQVTACAAASHDRCPRAPLPHVQAFFTHHLYQHKQASPQTMASDRDTLRLIPAASSGARAVQNPPGLHTPPPRSGTAAQACR